MARPLRIAYPGAFYHITSRGNERKAIFKSKSDREKFLEYLASAVVRYGAVIHTYCLMDNHYHLLLETPAGNISQIMRHINGAYTTYFNAKLKRAGHLFQGRYKSILVDINSYVQELSRYIHLNPVRAKMVGQPEEYEWSSYSSFIGKRESPEWLQRDFLLGYFGKTITAAEKGYKKFVEGMADREYESPLDRVVSSTLLGSPDFIMMIKHKYLSGMKLDGNVPALKELQDKAGLDEIFRTVDIGFQDNPAMARNVKMYLGRKYSGRELKEIGSFFGIGASGVSQCSRRVLARMKRDREIREKIQQIETALNLSKMKT